MSEHAIPTSVCAQVLGVSPSTVRRMKQPTRPSLRVDVPPDADRCAAVRSTVRATHGLVGAASLGRVNGLPRRICAEIKRSELRAMECERRARCATVRIAAPGIVRGFDAMHVTSGEGKAYWLVAADAAIPYRTSIATVRHYDASSVIRALRDDFDANGVPLVVRLDRIACQRTPEVQSLLDSYGVLALHGPPRHPYYYGQLERQNREHRAWLAVLPPMTHRDLAAAAGEMKTSLNTLWPRPTLNGCTADQRWRRRPSLHVDRRELRRDVQRCADGLIVAGVERLTAQRFAIESALTRLGLLTINHGGGAR